MARTKYTYNIEEVELTHVQSGDMDNKVFYSYFSENIKAKEEMLKIFLKKNALANILEAIFSGDISDDQFRRIAIAITFYDAVINITGASMPVTANDAFFAALVNWNVSKGNGANNPIRSYAAIASAKTSNEGKDLDYREYIINGENGNFNGDYISIVIFPKDFSCKIQINLPIVKLRLGFFRFATESTPAYMTIIGDPDNCTHIIPPNIWLSMIEEGMGRRKIATFSKLETRTLQRLVSTDFKYIEEILAINDFHKVIDFINAYDFKFEEDDGTLILVNTNEPPEIDVNGFDWGVKRNAYMLVSSKFYVVTTHGSAIRVLVQ